MLKEVAACTLDIIYLHTNETKRATFFWNGEVPPPNPKERIIGQSAAMFGGYRN